MASASSPLAQVTDMDSFASAFPRLLQRFPVVRDPQTVLSPCPAPTAAPVSAQPALAAGAAGGSPAAAAGASRVEAALRQVLANALGEEGSSPTVARAARTALKVYEEEYMGPMNLDDAEDAAAALRNYA